MIALEVKLARGSRLDRILSPKAVAFAEAQALNRTAANVQTAGLREVSRAMGISVTQLRKRGKHVEGRGRKFGAVAKGRRASRRRLQSSVIGTGRPFNAGRWNGRRVRVAGRRAGTQHEAYGRPQVAPRTWMLDNGAIVTQSGTSFRGVYGPGVGQMMQRPDVLRILEETATERFVHHFSKAVDFAFSTRAPAFLR